MFWYWRANPPMRVDKYRGSPYFISILKLSENVSLLRFEWFRGL